MTDLTCPKCQHALAPPTNAKAPLHTCSSCKGAWVDAEGIEAATKRRAVLIDIAKTEGAATELACPACNVDLVEVDLGPCSIDMCLSCEGAFFDRGEWRHVGREKKDWSQLGKDVGFVVGEVIVEGVCGLIAAAGEALG